MSKLLAPQPNTTPASHTPGPWKVLHESNDPLWSVVCDKHGNIIANVNAETGPDLPPLTPRIMPKDANANLISAAPDLLDALQEVDKILYHYLAEVHPTMVKIRAAIAKAKGE